MHTSAGQTDLALDEVMTERYAAARKHLRDADPVLARLIDKHPNLDPRAWMAERPKRTPSQALVFQIVGQKLSVRATRAILARPPGPCARCSDSAGTSPISADPT